MSRGKDEKPHFLFYGQKKITVRKIFVQSIIFLLNG